jgi:hypothetical protein
METVDKKLGLLVLALLIILLGLSGYIFFLKQQGKYQPRNLGPNWDLYEFSTLLGTGSYEDIALIMGTKDLRQKLKFSEYAKTKDKGVLLFTNPSDKYYAGDFSEPIVTSGAFRLLFNFDNQTTDSELIISGQDNWGDNQWWENIRQLRIGYNNEENGYYLSLRNGQEEHSCWWQFLENTKPGQSIIIEFADSQGRGFWVKDSGGQILKELDLTKETDLKMEDGLIPYSSFKVGVNLPPKTGRLLLHKLFFYEL